MRTTRCPAGMTAGAEVALGQQRAAGDRRLWLTAQLKGLPTAAQNRGLEQGLATGQGAWGARGALCCRHSLAASLNPPEEALQGAVGLLPPPPDLTFPVPKLKAGSPHPRLLPASSTMAFLTLPPCFQRDLLCPLSFPQVIYTQYFKKKTFW